MIWTYLIRITDYECAQQQITNSDFAAIRENAVDSVNPA